MTTLGYDFSAVPQTDWGAKTIPSWLSKAYTGDEAISSIAETVKNPSPTLPGKEGWGTQWGELFKGIGKGFGLAGAGIAMAKGNPMAGMMMQQFLEEKTGKKVESEDPLAAGKEIASILEKYGVVSPLVLNIGEGTTRMI